MMGRKKFLAKEKIVTSTRDDASLPESPKEGYISQIPSAGRLEEVVFCQYSISCL
jgi:hypothetical protein